MHYPILIQSCFYVTSLLHWRPDDSSVNIVTNRLPYWGPSMKSAQALVVDWLTITAYSAKMTYWQCGLSNMLPTLLVEMSSWVTIGPTEHKRWFKNKTRTSLDTRYIDNIAIQNYCSNTFFHRCLYCIFFVLHYNVFCLQEGSFGDIEGHLFLSPRCTYWRRYTLWVKKGQRNNKQSGTLTDFLLETVRGLNGLAEMIVSMYLRSSEWQWLLLTASIRL